MKRGYALGGIVIGFCALIAVFSLQGSAIPAHVDFGEAAKSRETCQVYGKLVQESIRMLDPSMTRVRFQLEDEKTGERLNVFYAKDEPVPANFHSASHIRAIGTYDRAEEAFRVSQLYTKCPSKYVSEGYKPESGASAAPAAPAAPTK